MSFFPAVYALCLSSKSGKLAQRVSLEMGLHLEVNGFVNFSMEKSQVNNEKNQSVGKDVYILENPLAHRLAR